MKIAICFVTAFILVACNKTYTPEAARPAIVVGDSIAYGTGTSHQRFNLASCLGKQTGAYFENMGVPGETTRGLLQRIESVIALKPTLVVLSIGGNDLQRHLVTRSFPARETLDNMEHIFSRLADANVKVYYINMTPPVIEGNAKSMGAAADGRLVKIQKLAADYPNVHVVANAMEGLWLNPQKMADEIHPNDLGYAEMCGRVFQQVKQSTRKSF